MTLLITGATIIDGVADKPIVGQAILIEGGRIAAIGKAEDLPVPSGATIIDGTGKHVIPGLMNANVHLLTDVRLETLIRYEGRYDLLIEEAAQIALKNGLTTVFDTWGPRRDLITARDRIAEGSAVGSRIYCAGNIIGFDGPFSPDFMPGVGAGSARFINRVNATWVENSGRHLMWLTPDEVAAEVRDYIDGGIDFVKYASNEHGSHSGGAFLAFSERQQRAIVDEAHRTGKTAQSHIQSVEGLCMAVEAGCDLITHCNITGPRAIPAETIDLMLARDTGAVIFPWTEKGMTWLRDHCDDVFWTMTKTANENARNLVKAGAKILLANDGGIFGRDALTDPMFATSWLSAPEDVGLGHLSCGHFFWLEAMEEMGMAAMDMLRAATINIASAYKLDANLGTIETGKIADLVILDADPLESAKNYRAIHAVVKDGKPVNTGLLPLNPMLTAELPDPLPEEARYRHALHTGQRFPMCPCCAIQAH